MEINNKNVFCLVDFNFDGRDALSKMLDTSEYGSLYQALASLSLFSHPDTVGRLNTSNVFLSIRGESKDKGEFINSVMHDDNTSPTDAFLWIHGWTTRPRDIQFNHVWKKSKSVGDYTNLANIVVTPSFLAKLTDSDPVVSQIMEYRVYELYRYLPKGEIVPDEPECYSKLIWADTLPPALNPEEIYRSRMEKKPKSRTTKSARELGWLFSKYKPDSKI